MNQRLKRLVTRHGIERLKISDATPNGDLLLDFLDLAVWRALCVKHDGDVERLREVLQMTMTTWNLSVLRRRGKMLNGDAIGDFLERNARFFEMYSARKDAFFQRDERLFLDVMIGPAEDGELEVNALATFPDFDGPAPEALVARLPQPRTRTERNRARRARRR